MKRTTVVLDRVVSLRCDCDELAKWRSIAEKFGMSLGELIRREMNALAEPVPDVPSFESGVVKCRKCRIAGKKVCEC